VSLDIAQVLSSGHRNLLEDKGNAEPSLLLLGFIDAWSRAAARED
jgi:hypothetical protein